MSEIGRVVPVLESEEWSIRKGRFKFTLDTMPLMFSDVKCVTLDDTKSEKKLFKVCQVLPKLWIFEGRQNFF